MPKLKRCLYCNNEFDRPLRTQKGKFKISWNEYKKRNFCSNKCRSQYHSEQIYGLNNPNYRGGKTKCINCGKKLAYRYSYRPTVRCRKCWKKFTRGKNHYLWKGGMPKCKICGNKTGDYYSKLCRKCYRGENHPFWKGGITTFQHKIRTIPQYRKWQMSVLRRDNFTCRECGIAGPQKRNNLIPHHIKLFSLILKENNIQSIKNAIKCKELWNIDNGITLCKKCHKKTSNFAKKLCI